MRTESVQGWSRRQRCLARRHPGQPLPLANGIGQIFAEHRLQMRLVVEHVKLRRRAGLSEIDDTLCPWREMAGFQRLTGWRVQQSSQSDGTDAGRRTREKLPSSGMDIQTESHRVRMHDILGTQKPQTLHKERDILTRILTIVSRMAQKMPGAGKVISVSRRVLAPDFLCLCEPNASPPDALYSVSLLRIRWIRGHTHPESSSGPRINRIMRMNRS